MGETKRPKHYFPAPAPPAAPAAPAPEAPTAPAPPPTALGEPAPAEPPPTAPAFAAPPGPLLDGAPVVTPLVALELFPCVAELVGEVAVDGAPVCANAELAKISAPAINSAFFMMTFSLLLATAGGASRSLRRAGWTILAAHRIGAVCTAGFATHGLRCGFAGFRVSHTRCQADCDRCDCEDGKNLLHGGLPVVAVKPASAS